MNYIQVFSVLLCVGGNAAKLFLVNIGGDREADKITFPPMLIGNFMELRILQIFRSLVFYPNFCVYKKD